MSSRSSCRHTLRAPYRSLLSRQTRRISSRSSSSRWCRAGTRSGSHCRVTLPDLMLVVRARGDRQLHADRLDPIGILVRVNETDHDLRGRSSSAWAKNAAALRRISFVCLSCLFSRSSSLTRSCSVFNDCVLGSCWRSLALTQFLSVSGLHPIFSATLRIAAHCDVCSFACSRTSLTARSRTSVEYLFGFPMIPSSQEKDSPEKPGRFTMQT